MHLTHNENIKTLEDAMPHLDLEEDHLMANKTSVDVYMTGSNSHGGKWCKHKFHRGNQQESQTDAQTKKKQKFNQPGKGKKKGFFKKKKHVSKLKCYNCHAPDPRLGGRRARKKLYWDSLPTFSDIGGPKSYN